MAQTIRVATFAGPGAPPVIRSVPRPAVPARAPGQREGRVRAVPELVPVVGGLSAG